MSVLVTCMISFLCAAISFGLAWSLIKFRGRSVLPLSRTQTDVVTDLDAIIGRTVGVRFHGRVHRIPPLSFEAFLSAVNALAELELLGKKKVVSIEEVRQGYIRLFQICCPSIVKDSDFSELNNQQMAALYKTVFEQIMGKPEMDAQKKSPVTAENVNLSAS